jgi:VIT1/CCC1 family predicted Fe2+/Mn2+ transporter
MLTLGVFLRSHWRYVALWIIASVLASSLLGFIMARFISEPANHALRGKRNRSA